MNLFGLGKNDENQDKSSQDRSNQDNSSSNQGSQENRKQVGSQQEGNQQESSSSENSSDQGTLQLREEQLSVNKSKVASGEVTLSKEVVEEQKSIDVPVKHEEVIIERRSIENKESDSPISSGETIHIPVSQEKVEVNKRTVVTGEITARKQEIEDTQHFEATVKKEEAHVDSAGDPTIITQQ